jgi:hypothetical protein
VTAILLTKQQMQSSNVLREREREPYLVCSIGQDPNILVKGPPKMGSEEQRHGSDVVMMELQWRRYV